MRGLPTGTPPSSASPPLAVEDIQSVSSSVRLQHVHLLRNTLCGLDGFGFKHVATINAKHNHLLVAVDWKIFDHNFVVGGHFARRGNPRQDYRVADLKSEQTHGCES
eukprot:SAG11_NODE_7344_length_1158_cov_1.066100_1_plen_106_part_10